MPTLVAFPIAIGSVMLLAAKQLTIAKSGAEVAQSTLFSNMFGPYDFMWRMATLVILWMGVFSAMDKSVAKTVVSKIK